MYFNQASKNLLMHYCYVYLQLQASKSKIYPSGISYTKHLLITMTISVLFEVLTTLRIRSFLVSPTTQNIYTSKSYHKKFVMTNQDGFLLLFWEDLASASQISLLRLLLFRRLLLLVLFALMLAGLFPCACSTSCTKNFNFHNVDSL